MLIGITRLLLDHLRKLSGLGAAANFWLLPGLTSCPELVETKWPGAEVSSLVKSALVADDLPWIQGRPAPAGRLCCVAVEAAPPEVLSFL